MMFRKRKMPSRKALAEYWMKSPPFDFGLAGVSWGFHDDELVSDECWACGDVLRLERCHIVSVCDGGTDDPSNLVILCMSCHVESEYLTPDVFPVWLRETRKTKWMQPWMHSSARMKRVGYDEAKLAELVKTMSPEDAAKMIFSKIYGDI